MREGLAFVYFQSRYDTTLFFLFRTYPYYACGVRVVFLKHGALLHVVTPNYGPIMSGSH